nr:Chain D, Paxillin [synthetic construct]1OW8_F Chain F, Paxillin [synthetic construct]3RQF_E Chain E, Paxillin LD2 peptide [Homo sapiens]
NLSELDRLLLELN